MDRVLAIAGLRFRLMARRLRGPGGVMNVLGSVVLGSLGVVFAAAGALGLGVLVHVFAAGDDPDKLRIGFMVVFYFTLFMGIVLPLLRGAMDQGFDASPFVIFPIARSRLYWITLAAGAVGTDHLLYYPTLVAVAITGVLLPGVDPFTGLALIALLASFSVIWSNLLALLLVSVMRARRVREIVAIVVLLLLIVASFAPAIFDESAGGLVEQLPQLETALGTVMRIASVLPPSIAADGLTALHGDQGRTSATLGALWLFSWNAGGLLLGYFVFHRYHLTERGVRVRSSPRGKRMSSSLDRLFSFDARPLAALPSEIRAVASKDFLYLLRSVVGRFVLFITPIFVFVIVFGVGRGLKTTVFGLQPDRLLLFGIILYAVLFSNNFVNNAFAWESDGIKSYFLTPVSLRQVLIGKNLAVWLYNLILFALVLISWSLVMGFPDPLTSLTAVFLYATALLSFTSFGNIISVLFPVARDMSTARNQPSQIAIVLSLIVLLGNALVLGPFLSIPAMMGWSAIQPALMAIVFAIMTVVYSLTLRQAARMFEQRREKLIASLKKAG